MASWADIPALPSAQPANGSETKILDTFGRLLQRECVQLDLFGDGSKTSADTFPSGSTKYTETFLKWVTLLKQEYTQRKKWERGISVSASLSSPYWLTPLAKQNEQGYETYISRMRNSSNPKNYLKSQPGSLNMQVAWQTPVVSRGDYQNQRDGSSMDKLAGQVKWRTPTADQPGITTDRLEGDLGGRLYDKETGRNVQYGLGQQVEMTPQVPAWPTPTAMDNQQNPEDLKARAARLKAKHTGRDGTKHSGNGCGPSLGTAVQMWPTPRASESDQGDTNRQKMINAGSSWLGQNRGATLTTAAKANWPTPRANKTTSENQESWELRQQEGKVRVPPLGLAVKWVTPNTMHSMIRGSTPVESQDRHTPDLINQVTVSARPTPHTTMTTGPGTGGRQGGMNIQTAVAGQHSPDSPSIPGKHPGQSARSTACRVLYESCGIPYGRILRRLWESKYSMKLTVTSTQQLNPAWVSQLMGTTLQRIFFVPLATP